MIRLHLGLREAFRRLTTSRARRERTTLGVAEPLLEGPRLNLGAGEATLTGWWNIDLRRRHADVVAEVARLPCRDGAVAAILARDVLEHFWRDETAALLAEWKRVLKPSGWLILHIPNLVVLADEIKAMSGERLTLVIENVYGGHRWGPAGAWDTHHWGWTPATIEADLSRAGFSVVSNDGRENMTVVAIRS